MKRRFVNFNHTVLRASLCVLCILLCQSAVAAETRDLILVAGQSNAVGYDAKPSELPANAADKDVMFWWRCGDPPPDDHDSTSGGKWTHLQPQPLGNPQQSKQGRQYGNFAQADGGFGPEIGLARALRAKQPRPLAIVKAAFSGTAMAQDWNPADPGPGGACYRALVAETKAAIAAAKQQDIALRPRALVWVQGESDANAKAAPLYEQALGDMISALRKDLDAPGMIALVGVNTRFGGEKQAFMPKIVQAQQALAAKLPRCAYVDTATATIANGAHFDTAGTLDVGQRFAEALVRVEAQPTAAQPAAAPQAFNDPQPQRYQLTARASRIDPRAREHAEIDFLFEKDGKVLDLQHASVDTRVTPRGKLVIWLMGHNAGLFDRVSGYGLHAIQVHYANGWFGKLAKQAPPGDDKYLGRIRLEAATGQDVSDAVVIPPPDGMMERSVQFVKWLAKENPQGRWEQFLTPDGQGLRWEDCILAGISHGSTTAARFAIHQRVDRVVMLSGPRDQTETWQSLPSATPSNRYFGFTHVLDGGWVGDHYCRSWELLGLHQHGAIVNVDETPAPYNNSRRLITTADVKNDANRAHSSAAPGGAAVKDASGQFIHEPVWRYLFTHPVDLSGEPVAADKNCKKDLR